MNPTLASSIPVSADTPARPGLDARLDPIIRKVTEGQRLCAADGLLLYETPDIWTVCSLADLVRRRLHGDVAYFNINRHINYSNVCALSCTFCAFYRKKDQDGAYEYSVEKIAEEARQAQAAGATELHIVGGLHPWLKFEYYIDMMRAIRQAAPRLHIKAFTAVEIVHLARIAGRGRDGLDGIRSVLADLKDAGLGSLGLPAIRLSRLSRLSFSGRPTEGAGLLSRHQALACALGPLAADARGECAHRRLGKNGWVSKRGPIPSMSRWSRSSR